MCRAHIFELVASDHFWLSVNVFFRKDDWGKSKRPLVEYRLLPHGVAAVSLSQTITSGPGTAPCTHSEPYIPRGPLPASLAGCRVYFSRWGVVRFGMQLMLGQFLGGGVFHINVDVYPVGAHPFSSSFRELT